MQQVVSDADQGPMGAQVVGRLREFAKAQQKDNLANTSPQLAPDWDRFIRKVQAQAK
jgi:hypothetical protein